MATRKGLGQANVLRTNNNTSTGYGIVYADEVSGHRTVANLTALYALNDWQLSASGDNTNSDAIGQLWYVVNADGNGNGCYYQLKDWSKRNEAAGWSIADYTTKAELQDKIDNIATADEEDITTEGDTPKTQVLKLKDRAYDSLNASGKGYKILRKNWQSINGERKNVLTQDMINEPNTIYEIRYDFDLNGGYIIIHNNAQLLFYGGMLSNGKIVFDGNVEIISGYQCFGTNIILSAKQDYKAVGISKIKAVWFGATADCNKYKLDEESTDNYTYLQKAIDIANQLRAPLVLEKGTYRISQSLNIPDTAIIEGETLSHVVTFDSERYANDTNRQTEILLDSSTHNVIFNVKKRCVLKNLKLEAWKTKDVTAIYTDGETLDHSTFENIKICRCKYAFNINPANGKGLSSSTFNHIYIYKCDAGFLFNGEGKTGTYITACVFNDVIFDGCKAYCVNLITENNISDILFSNCQVEYLNTGDEFNSEYYNQYGCHAFIFNSKGWQGLISLDSCYIEGVIPFKTVNGKNILNENCSVEDISCIMFSNCLLSINNTRFANNLVLCDLKEKTQLYMHSCISDNTNVYKDDNIINNGLFRKTGTDISHISIDTISLKRNFIPFEGDNTYMRADIRNIMVDYIEYKDFKYLAGENINIYISQNGGGDGLSIYRPISFANINNKTFISNKVSFILIEDITINEKVQLNPQSIVLNLNKRKLTFSNERDYFYYITIPNIEELIIKNGVISFTNNGVFQTLFSFAETYYSGKNILLSDISFVDVAKNTYFTSQTASKKWSIFLQFNNISKSGDGELIVSQSAVEAKDFKTFCKEESFRGLSLGSLVLLS